MTSHLGRYIKSIRLRLGLTPQQLSKAIGYKNADKGGRRICALEDTGKCEAALLAKVITALELRPEGIEFAKELDHGAWLDRKNTVQPSSIVVRYSAGIYGHQSLPAKVETQADAEAYASELAMAQRVMVCLNWRGRHQSWLNRDGEVYARTET